MADTLHALTVIGIRQPEREAPCLVLRDEQARQLTIPIRLCEAFAIQLALDGEPPERPQTHDLILAIARQLHAQVTRAVIDDFSQGTYFARLLLKRRDEEISLDCRPSDAIALALRARAPIFASEDVILGKESA